LLAALPGSGATATGLSVPDRSIDPPTPAADPFVVAAWWAALPVDARARATRDHAVMLADLDGMPADVRDACNRQRLAVAVAAARAELRSLAATEDEARVAGYRPASEAELRRVARRRLE